MDGVELLSKSFCHSPWIRSAGSSSREPVHKAGEGLGGLKLEARGELHGADGAEGILEKSALVNRSQDALVEVLKATTRIEQFMR